MNAGPAQPASRNAPCPCGSGRRYKECHGQVADAASGPKGLTSSLVARMHEALAAQRAGRFDEAIAGYDEVIVGAPGTYDAWHMRGVAHFQSHRFDAAEADILQALALRPDIPMGRNNLALVEGGRRMARAEEAVSRAALGRFRPLVVDPAVDPLDGVGPDTRCFIVDLGAAQGLVRTLENDARRAGATVRRVTMGEDGRLGADEEGALGATRGNDVVVAVGTRFALDDWTLACAPRAMALVADGPLLAPVEDRLRELSGQRRRRVRLAATQDAVDLAPLPHARIGP